MSIAPLYLVETTLALAVPRALGRQYLEAHGQTLPDVIYPEVRVLTAEKATANKTFYPESSLRGDPEQGTGLASFIRPYPIPVIRDHLTHPSSQGAHASDVYGRVEKLPQFMKLGGEAYIRALPTINHPEAIEAVLSGRWMTVSLGSKVDSVNCSICGTDLTRVDHECEHDKGSLYEVNGQQTEALWRIGPIRAKEISFVVTPSDDQAMVTNRNVSEGTVPAPRVLIGNSRGIFDLETGVRAENPVGQALTALHPRSGRSPSGPHFPGFTPLKEQTMPQPTDTNPPVPAVAPAVGTPRAPLALSEDFRGPGRYLLLGSSHDHESMLDQYGDGQSTAAYWSAMAYNSTEAPYDGDADVNDDVDRSHTHLIVGGRVLHSGKDASHNHYIEPAHAAMETADQLLTLGFLYQLPDTDEQFGSEATLTTQQRKNLATGTFCGPNRSFPAPDRAHVTAGLRLLGRAKLSDEQQAAVRACLIRKGKEMGMTFDNEITHAARLVDATCRVEFPLYLLPTTAPALELLTAQLQAMPHSPSQREAIDARFAAAAREFLPPADWQARFGSLPACEAGPAIEISLTAESYPLLYAAMQHGLIEGRAPLVPPAPAAPVSEAVPAAPPATGPPITDPANAAAPSEPHPAPLAAPVPPVLPDLPEAAGLPAVVGISTAQPEAHARELAAVTAPFELKIQELDDLAREALAHSVALYLRSLRKALVRNKTQLEVVALLKPRSVASLRDTLADLSVEWDGSDQSEIARLPLLTDPTAPDPEGGPTTGRTAGAAEEQALEANQPPCSLTALEELPLEEGEPDVIRVKTQGFLVELFPALTA